MERKSRRSAVINNDFYDDLHEDWYACDNHPIALLRAENAVRVPWIVETIQGDPCTVLDMGCGGGYLTNALSKEGHAVTGIDLSKSSLEMAAQHDETGNVQYLHCNAYDVPFADASFDVVCAMDILEHVEEPERLIKEASRLLKKGGASSFTLLTVIFSAICSSSREWSGACQIPQKICMSILYSLLRMSSKSIAQNTG